MPKGMAVIIDSLRSRLHGWAQSGVSRDNACGIGGSVVLMESRMRVSGGVYQSSGG